MKAISKTINQNKFVAESSERLQQKSKEIELNLRTYKCYTKMSYEEFKGLIVAYATEILVKRSITQAYVVDQQNGPTIKQLYFYFTNNPLCKWNLNSGLIFGGKVGCGKSVLMTAYLRVSNEYTRKMTTIIHSKTLAGQIRSKGVEFYEKRPLFIDELGREESEVKDYGNIVKPVIDLFAIRYEAGARTFATTNFNYKSIEKFYGEFIRSRMEEMMTFVIVPGESRRLKNEVKSR